MFLQVHAYVVTHGCAGCVYCLNHILNRASPDNASVLTLLHICTWTCHMCLSCQAAAGNSGNFVQEQITLSIVYITFFQ